MVFSLSIVMMSQQLQTLVFRSIKNVYAVTLPNIIIILLLFRFTSFILAKDLTISVPNWFKFFEPSFN